MNKLYALSLVATLTAISYSAYGLKSVSSTEFNNIVTNNNIVVVDFYADWCAPCKAMKSTLKQVEEEYSNITFIAVNIDNQNTLANKFNIRSIPTLIFFKNGTEISRIVGKQSKPQIINKIKSILKN